MNFVEASADKAAKGPRGLAVIVSYKSAATIGRCLTALHEAQIASGMRWETVVVDNASGDEISELVAPPARLLCNPTNDGFAKATNQAVREAMEPHDLLLILNPDCFVSPNALEVCRDWLDDHPRDAAVVQLLNTDGTLQPSAGAAPLPTRLIRMSFSRRPRTARAYLNDTAPLSARPRQVDWAHMAFFMLRSATYLALEGLDENFWLYGEDLDFCLRLREQGGSVWWLPHGHATHIGGHSTAGIEHLTQARFLASLSHVLKKHSSRTQRALYRTALPVLYLFRAARYRRRDPHAAHDFARLARQAFLDRRPDESSS